MVQTQQGTDHNTWITYMRKCAAEYHASKKQENSDKGGKPKRRVTGKRSVEAQGPPAKLYVVAPAKAEAKEAATKPTKRKAEGAEAEDGKPKQKKNGLQS
jgi:hypothetical protein